MVISINIEDKNLLAQLLSNLGKEKLLEMVEELDKEMHKQADSEQKTPIALDEDDAEEIPEPAVEQAAPINNEEQPFNGECRYNPEFSCSAPDPENCILCPRYSSGNEF